MAIKVGDRVISVRLNVEGIVVDIQPCLQCDKTEFTLDKEGSPVRFYYHTGSFEVIDSQKEKEK